MSKKLNERIINSIFLLTFLSMGAIGIKVVSNRQVIPKFLNEYFGGKYEKIYSSDRNHDGKVSYMEALTEALWASNPHGAHMIPHRRVDD